MAISATSGDPCFIVMAKQPMPGQSKTRLVTPDGFTDDHAATIAAAMLRCMVMRLDRLGSCMLAVTPDGCGMQVINELQLPEVDVIDQGSGDLGQRLDHVWRQVDSCRPVVFFGMDSPDVPMGHLSAIPPALQTHELAVGPTDDGGYWTLAARRYLPAVLKGIDWGSDRVYHQTCEQARRYSLSLHELPAWNDVDTPRDVRQLMHRLHGDGGEIDPALVELREALTAILPRSLID